MKKLGRITHYSAHGSQLSIEFNYGMSEFQCYSINIKNLVDLMKFFNISDVLDLPKLIGKYAYCILSDELNPLITDLEMI